MADGLPAVVVLNGSERFGGNTDQVVGVVGKIVERSSGTFSEYRLRDYSIVPCGPCADCNSRSSTCEIQDDVAMLVARMAAADVIVYAAPVHGFGMAELMQRFIERAGVGHMRFRRPLADKIGCAVVTGRRYNHEHVMSQLIYNMLLNRMILVGSGFPSFVHGGRPGTALTDDEGMLAVQQTIERAVSMATVLKTIGPDELRLLQCTAPNERIGLPEQQNGIR